MLYLEGEDQISTDMENIIIYGGSFDPIHNGHLRMAQAASLSFNADVIFVPAKSPRWKKPDSSIKDRLAMLRTAIRFEGSSSFSISLFEVNSKAEVNYTIDTVQYFKKRFPKARLYFLLGADSVETFPKWKDAEEIAELATPIYCPRPGIALDDKILEKYGMARLPFDHSGDVSSSAVRSLQSTDIPLKVREYIEAHELYYIRELKSHMKPTRLKHSIRVANLAYYIAQKNRVEGYWRAYVAGLLHDIGKYIPIEEQRKLAKENYPEYADLPDWAFHQFAGAVKAKEIFGIQDEVILDAIAYHATGKMHMSPLAKILYCADKIEPGRGYDSRPLIDACLKNYYVGFLTVLGANKEYLMTQKGYIIDNPLTESCMSLYLGEEN